MASPIEVVFLRDTQHGGSADQPGQVAAAFAAFVDAATTSLDMAIYDMRLADPSASDAVAGALLRAADRGVVVRLGYDAGGLTARMHAEAVARPAGGGDFADRVALAFAAVGGDPAPPGTPDWIKSHFDGTNVHTRAIHAGHQLMHSKFVVRDAPITPPPTTADETRTTVGRGAVWTGSTNFTDDAWTRQENNILIVSQDKVAAGYRTDFDQMWGASAINGAGAGAAGHATLAGSRLDWDFCPGDGAAINAALAARIAAATRRLVVGSMVLTSHEVLAALAAAVRRGVAVSGIYDASQMGPIAGQWKSSPRQGQTLADWTTVSAVLVGKRSTPYTPTGPHDFMHLKVLVADDTVTTGSYNFSANAERNAENQVTLDDPRTVAAYADYLATVTKTYG